MAGIRNTVPLRQQLAAVMAAHVCLHMAMTGMRMSAPLFALHEGKSQAAAGLLVSLFAISQIFISLPAGRYSDVHGLKKPVRRSIFLTVFAVGLAAIWQHFIILCVTAVLCGGAVGVATISLQRHVGRVAANPVELREAFSWVSIAPAVSNFMGPFCAGLLIDYAGFQAAFVMLALMPMASWVILRKVQEPHRKPVNEQRRKSPAWDLLTNRSFLWLLILGWFMNASWDLHGFLVPILGHERGLSASIIGSIVGSFAIGAAAIRVVIPLFARRMREWLVITLSTAVAGVSILAYPFTEGPISMGVLSFGLGVALGLVQPMVMSMLHQIAPDHRQGEALALRLILVNFSGVGLPLLLGAIGGVSGTAAAFWLVGSIVSAGSLFGIKLPRNDGH